MKKSKLDGDKEGKAIDPSHFRDMIGTLLYLTASRSDLQIAIYMCARYQARPTKKHLHAVKRIFRYLRETVNRVLWYPKDSSIALTAFADADHVGCQDTRRSTSGSLQFLRDRFISWSSKRHKSAAISSTKAEYIALSKHIDIIYHFIKEHVENGDSSVALTAFADADHAGCQDTRRSTSGNADHEGCQDTRRSTSGSMQMLGDRLVSWSSKRQKSAAISSTEAKYTAFAIALCYNNVQHSWLKHIDIRYHVIKEQVENGVVKLYFVRTEYQFADIFTKALCQERIEFLIDKLRMRSFTPEILKELADEAEE
nr:copia protein [Tanacetum cinerariifolium]